MTAFTPNETAALIAVEVAARKYAAFSHGNLSLSKGYRAREEAREGLRDALAHLDYVRRPVMSRVTGHDHEWVENNDWNGGPSDRPIWQCVVCNEVAV